MLILMTTGRFLSLSGGNHYANARMAEAWTIRRGMRRCRACRYRFFLGRLGHRRNGPRDGDRSGESRCGHGFVPDLPRSIEARSAACRACCGDQGRLILENRGDLVMKNGWATMPGTAQG